MGTLNKDIDLGFSGWGLVGAVAGLMVLAWVVLLGTRARQAPTRCEAGFTQAEARCCAPGQAVSAGQCVGIPRSCPEGFFLVSGENPGCVYKNSKLHIPGGSVVLGPTDWDSIDVVEKKTVAVVGFYMDDSEVTHYRHGECVKAGMCQANPVSAEPGLPVTLLSAKQAQNFCAFSGGRLPTPAEWIFAASGEEARRFPWGPHGLVCRRATFGLTDGPCAEKGITPDVAGSRPAGATPHGLLDMAGNVAEWTISPGSAPQLMGGSFRSRTASELKVWAARPAKKGDDAGFRCVYPVRKSVDVRAQ